MYTKMREGIRKARVFLAFFTTEYCQKANAGKKKLPVRYELAQADRLNLQDDSRWPLHAVILEPEMTDMSKWNEGVEGTLLSMFGDTIYTDISSDDSIYGPSIQKIDPHSDPAAFERRLMPLVEDIKRILRT
jgi:hypothetical protein